MSQIPYGILQADGTRLPAKFAGVLTPSGLAPVRPLGAWKGEHILSPDGTEWERRSTPPPDHQLDEAVLTEMASINAQFNLVSHVTGPSLNLTTSVNARRFMPTPMLGIPPGTVIISATLEIVFTVEATGGTAVTLLNDVNTQSYIVASDLQAPTFPPLTMDDQPVNMPSIADFTVEMQTLVNHPGWSIYSGIKLNIHRLTQSRAMHTPFATIASVRPRAKIVYEVPGEPKVNRAANTLTLEVGSVAAIGGTVQAADGALTLTANGSVQAGAVLPRIQVVNTATGAAQVQGATTYPVSVEVRGDGTSGPIELRAWQMRADATYITHTTLATGIVSDGTWKRVTGSLTTHADTRLLGWQIGLMTTVPAPAGTKLDARCLLIGSSGDYFDGDSPGAYWEGQRGLSTSIFDGVGWFPLDS